MRDSFLSSDPVGSKSPTVAKNDKINMLDALLGDSFGLLCQAQGFPLPSFR
jgi:hypothetical protein